MTTILTALIALITTAIIIMIVWAGLNYNARQKYGYLFGIIDNPSSTGIVKINGSIIGFVINSTDYAIGYKTGEIFCSNNNHKSWLQKKTGWVFKSFFPWAEIGDITPIQRDYYTTLVDAETLDQGQVSVKVKLVIASKNISAIIRNNGVEQSDQTAISAVLNALRVWIRKHPTDKKEVEGELLDTTDNTDNVLSLKSIEKIITDSQIEMLDEESNKTVLIGLRIYLEKRLGVEITQAQVSEVIEDPKQAEARRRIKTSAQELESAKNDAAKQVALAGADAKEIEIKGEATAKALEAKLNAEANGLEAKLKAEAKGDEAAFKARADGAKEMAKGLENVAPDVAIAIISAQSFVEASQNLTQLNTLVVGGSTPLTSLPLQNQTPNNKKE